MEQHNGRVIVLRTSSQLGKIQLLHFLTKTHLTSQQYGRIHKVNSKLIFPLYHFLLDEIKGFELLSSKILYDSFASLDLRRSSTHFSSFMICTSFLTANRAEITHAHFPHMFIQFRDEPNESSGLEKKPEYNRKS